MPSPLTVSKAIAGFIVTGLVSFLTQRGIIIEPQYSDAVTILLSGAIGFVVVYFSPKNKETK